MSLNKLRKHQSKISHFYVLARTHGDSEAAAKVVDEVEEMKKTLSAVSGEMNYILTVVKCVDHIGILYVS